MVLEALEAYIYMRVLPPVCLTLERPLPIVRNKDLEPTLGARLQPH